MRKIIKECKISIRVYFFSKTGKNLCKKNIENNFHIIGSKYLNLNRIIIGIIPEKSNKTNLIISSIIKKKLQLCELKFPNLLNNNNFVYYICSNSSDGILIDNSLSVKSIEKLYIFE